MSSNDTLLMHMIEQDMKARNIAQYAISDHKVLDPLDIPVGGNEIVYIHNFQALGEFGNLTNFYVEMTSTSSATHYELANTIQGNSTHITRHLGNISFTGFPFPLNYYVQFIRVKF